MVGQFGPTPLVSAALRVQFAHILVARQQRVRIGDALPQRAKPISGGLRQNIGNDGHRKSVVANGTDW
jgi:hypothetical protein